MQKLRNPTPTVPSLLLIAALAAPAVAGDAPAGEFKATPLGAGTYSGGQGEIAMMIPEGEKREIVTVRGDMPVGSKVGFHYHPGHALVVVTEGEIASYDSAECEPSATYAAGEAFFDFPGHKHDIVNVGDGPAAFVVTFLLSEGEEPLHPVEDPGRENCHGQGE